MGVGGSSKTVSQITKDQVEDCENFQRRVSDKEWRRTVEGTQKAVVLAKKLVWTLNGLFT